MRRYDRFNPKRRIAATGSLSQSDLDELSSKAVYSGNPEHKRSPGDFGLTPPASPRPGKTLCDVARIFRRDEAHALLREGIRRGIVSETIIDGWPKQVWSVSQGDIVLEAQQDRPGSYHGYPLAPGDAFRELVLRAWNAKND